MPAIFGPRKPLPYLPLPLQILRQSIYREMVPLRKAVLPSSSFLLLLHHSPKAMEDAEADIARATEAASLAKYHMTWPFCIPVPPLSPSHLCTPATLWRFEILLRSH